MAEQKADQIHYRSINSSVYDQKSFNDLHQKATQAIIDRDEPLARMLNSKIEQKASEMNIPDLTLQAHLLSIKVNNAFFDISNWFKNIYVALDYCSLNQQDVEFYEKCEAAIRNQLAQYYAYINDYESAIKEYQNAIVLAKKGEDGALVVDILKSIGGIFNVIDQGEMAINYFEQAIEYGITQEVDEIGPILATMVNAAFIYDETKQYEKAIETAMKGLVIMQAHDYDNAIISAFLHNNIASSHLGLGQIERARFHINQSIESYEKIGSFPFLKDVTQFMNARVIWAEGAHQKAIEKMDGIALQLSESTDDNVKPDWIMYVLQTTADYHNTLGNHEKAAQYYQRYAQFIKSHLNVNLNHAIAVLQNEFEFQKQQQELASARITLENQALLVNRQRTLILLVLVIAAAIFLISLVYWNAMRRHKAMNLELKMTNKKLNTAIDDRELLIKEVNHRVKNNLQLISSLINLQRRRNKNQSMGDSNNELGVLTEVQGRVETIALIHNELYRTDDIKFLNVANLVDKISTYLISLFPYTVDIQKDLDDTNISIDAAIPVGLIACEVINNSLKHAATSKTELKIDIQLIQRNSGWHLSIVDNGPGFDTEKDMDHSASLGMVLIKSMSQQIQADYQFSRRPTSGTCFELHLVST